MVSRPMTRADVINQIESVLQDSSNAKWSAAELNLLLDDAITEVSEAVPYVMRDVYQIESRTGIASSTLANNLVDATESQFVSAAFDKGKVVYNTTDKTWAVIEGFTSATTVALSADIMASGEHYEIYNKACWSRKQINIEDSSDFLWIIGAVYPVTPGYNMVPFQNMRNVTLYSQNKIAEIDVSSVDDSKDADADDDVHLYVARQHKLNPMTDLDATNNGGTAVGATTMILAGLTDADTPIYKDTLFTVQGDATSAQDLRYTYRVTDDATIATQATTISFFPKLEAAVATGAAVTFVRSTLTPDLERIIVQMVAGEALMSESISLINTVTNGDAHGQYFRVGERMAEKARARLKGMVDVDLRAERVYSR